MQQLAFFYSFFSRPQSTPSLASGCGFFRLYLASYTLPGFWLWVFLALPGHLYPPWLSAVGFFGSDWPPIPSLASGCGFFRLWPASYTLPGFWLWVFLALSGHLYPPWLPDVGFFGSGRPPIPSMASGCGFFGLWPASYTLHSLRLWVFLALAGLLYPPWLLAVGFFGSGWTFVPLRAQDYGLKLSFSTTS